MSTVVFQVEGQRFWRRAQVTGQPSADWLTVEYLVAGRPTSVRVHVSRTLPDEPSDIRSGDEVLVESPTEPGVFWRGSIRTQHGADVEVRVPGMGKAGRDAVWRTLGQAVRRVPLVVTPTVEL